MQGRRAFQEGKNQEPDVELGMLLACWQQHGGQRGLSEVTKGEAQQGNGAGSSVLQSEQDGKFSLLPLLDIGWTHAKAIVIEIRGRRTALY